MNIKDQTILLVLSGSRAYGTSTHESDYDYRGIAIPPIDSYIGVLNKFEHAVAKDLWKQFDTVVQPESDMQIYELTKFVGLAAQNNPSILEVLFTDDYIIKHPVMDKLIDNRDMFLSKASKHRFCGYAYQQLNRIKRHKKWLDNPPAHAPERSAFGLPENGRLKAEQIGAGDSLIQSQIDEWAIDFTNIPEDVKIHLIDDVRSMVKVMWRAVHEEPYPIPSKHSNMDDALYVLAAREIGFSESLIEMLTREKRYRAAKQEWDSFQNWKINRNPKRAAVEAKHGFDLKHAMHLVRLIRMAREILKTGKVLVKRPDADELCEIRNGAWSYEQIVEFAENEDKALNDVMLASKLPKVADMKKIHKLTCDMVVEYGRI